MKSGNVNFLEPFGSLQACNGTALPLLVIVQEYIKMDLQDVGGGCEDWMELAQDRDRWRALVSTVMTLRVPKMRGIS